jgi:hypothetical protein
VPQPLATGAGMHRISWDVRYEMPPAFIHYMAHVTGAVPGDTHWGGEGPLVIPGVYTLRMNVDDTILTQTVTVKNDPGSRATATDLAALHDLQMKLYNGTRTSWDGFQQVAAMRAAIADVTRGSVPKEVADVAAAFTAKLTQLAGPTTFTGGRGPSTGSGQAGGGGVSFSVINGVEAEEGAVLVSMNGQLKVIDMSDIPPNPTKLAAWRNVCTDLRSALTSWQAINATDLVAFNALLLKNNLKPVAPATPMLPLPVCGTAASVASRDR